jgi:hypothetical protein
LPDSIRVIRKIIIFAAVEMKLMKMKKIVYTCLLALVAVAFASCHDSETYADQKKKERAAITDYVKRSGIKVISESEFKAKGCVTDTAKNEYVVFDDTGVYMQICRKGCGEPIKQGETATVLCRFVETNLLTDSVQLSNKVLYYSSIVDKLTVTNSSGSFTATFDTGSVMYAAYKSTSVPTGWLVPLSYINIGRQDKPNDEIAKVKIIVPHDSGHQLAIAGVYPCLYELTYERGR